jgi:hypothetical protein
MPSRILALFLGLIAAAMLFLGFRGEQQFAPYAVPPGVLLAIVLTFGDQINWWWYSRFPPDIDEGGRRFLERFYRPYLRLGDEARKIFRQKVALFQMSLDFREQGMEQRLPEDFRLIVAVSAVILTYREHDYLLPKFPVIVVYRGPFPSPQYPELFHASELYEEDGVLLFSAQHLMKGFTEPQKYYDVALHEWARAFILSYPGRRWPDPGEETWGLLERVSGFSKAALQSYVNRPDLELLPAAVVHYIHFPEKFGEYLPELSAAIAKCLGMAGK